MTERLSALFRARSLAFIGGASAEAAIEVVKRAGFDGTIFAVNPRRETLAGVPAVPNLGSLPATPDAAFVAVPAQGVVETVATLSRMGVGGAVVYSAGFAELGQDGEQLQHDLVTAAGSMALIGPNSSGVLNFVSGAHLWPFQHGSEQVPRGIAFVTQSGMLGNTLTLNDRSLPIAYVISAGNQAVCSIEEIIESLNDNAAVSAIALYIEGLTDIRRFAAAVHASVERGVPVVAMKAGTSSIGANLTQTHTGSLAGADALYRHLFERLGVITVDSPIEMVETLKLLEFAGAPKGRQILGLTCSGGDATMLADNAERLGLELTAFNDDVASEVASRLPPLATVSNPLDYTTPLWGNEEALQELFGLMLSQGYDAAVLVQDYLPEPNPDNQFSLADARAFASATRAHGVPGTVVSVLPENMPASIRSVMTEQRIAPLQGIEYALKAMSACSRVSDHDPMFAPRLGSARSTSNTLRAESVWLDEWAGKQLLATGGVVVPRGRCVKTEALESAASELTYPLVLKAVHPDLKHKSDVGAVKVGIRDSLELTQAARSMREAVSGALSDVEIANFIVEEMVTDTVAELLLGFYRDPLFGPVLVLGSGGVLVELVADTCSIVLPAQPHIIERAIKRLRVARLLAGFRGRSSVDTAWLAEQIATLADRLLFANVVECDINPLMITPTSAIAVDVLVRVAD